MLNHMLLERIHDIHTSLEDALNVAVRLSLCVQNVPRRMGRVNSRRLKIPVNVKRWLRRKRAVSLVLAASQLHGSDNARVVWLK